MKRYQQSPGDRNMPTSSAPWKRCWTPISAPGPQPPVVCSCPRRCTCVRVLFMMSPWAHGEGDPPSQAAGLSSRSWWTCTIRASTARPSGSMTAKAWQGKNPGSACEAVPRAKSSDEQPRHLSTVLLLREPDEKIQSMWQFHDRVAGIAAYENLGSATPERAR